MIKPILLLILITTVKASIDEILNNNKSSNNNETETDLLFTNPTPRIVGGSPITDKHAYPFYTLLIDDSGDWICGGTLIAPNVVLGAAHCTDTLKTIQKVQIGRIRITEANESNSTWLDEGNAVFFEANVVEIRKHPNYNPLKLWDADYALYILDEKFDDVASFRLVYVLYSCAYFDSFPYN